MPRIVLTSSSVAYNLVTLCQAQNKNFPASPRELEIQMPDTTIEAGNGGADYVKIGSPNSNTAPTDLTTVDQILATADNSRKANERGIPASEWWLKGSSNNNVLNVLGS
jgi:hypothetical protein